MGNDESVGTKKKGTSGLGLVPGFRRTTRSQSSKVRKSRRVEKRGPEFEMSSLLRRSGRENKFQSPSSNSGPRKLTNKESLKNPGGSRKEEEEEEIVKAVVEVVDKSEKEIEESSRNVGEKRKKRINARHFKAMFNLGVSETESKKRRVENSNGNVDSHVGDPWDRISENCEHRVYNGHTKSEGLQVECNEHGDSDRGNNDEELQESSDEDVDRGVEEPDEKPQECSGGEDMEGDCEANTNGCIGSEHDVKKSVNFVGGEVDGCVVEELTNHEIPSGCGRRDNGNDSVCSPNELIIDGSVDGEGSPTNTKNIVSGSPVFRLSSLTEDCANCSNKPRLKHDSLEHKDTAESSDATDECWKTNTNDPPADVDQVSCVICKDGGELLRCNGKACRISYHPSCLWTREENAHIPIWYCSGCMKKKLVLGVHSVSEGIESVLDAREVEISNSEGGSLFSAGTLEKQYFVKYKGFAHIHNCWIPETQLHHEAPNLIGMFNEQDKSWKPEWAVPHRLLLRRSISNADIASKNHYEWLVKWCGLDYDQATWESEDSAFFKKPEAQQLLKEYETRHSGSRSLFPQLQKESEIRHDEAKDSNISGDNQIQERKKILHAKHGKHSDSLRFENASKLREFHEKRHDVVLLDEQDRANKIIHFISSILSIVSRPFLIIAPRDSISYWEAEFVRFTSSINVVVYDGNTDSRKIIRSVEFYREVGELMFQVLLSSVEAISEDLEEIKGMDWEAVIVDGCQEHCILGNAGCINTLVTNWKLLLFNAQLKDTVAEYINILSLLEPVGSSNQNRGLVDASNRDINVLKERLCSFIISPRFQEYWVPIELSNVQLEQYCSLMLSNSSVLCLCSKSDQMGSLQNILVSIQKCCDHPYLVNPLLRQFLLPEQPPQDAALDMGVKASGKLQLLDVLLSEFRNQGLKVLILYQPISGSGKDNLDIILDDFLTWRFGEDSYEHVAAGGQPSTKKAALNKFNNDRNRSFLLMETRACGQSVKLSKVDSVIILNSDEKTPLNDLKSLQKIAIDPKLKPIYVFRFYCSCTVEEKALIISKNEAIPENLQQISASTKQMLLMWGASYLFSRLDDFHCDMVLDSKDNIAFGSSFMMDVCKEIVSVVKNYGNINPCKHISLARYDGRCYLTTTSLLGEQRTELEEGLSSNKFWLKLLDRKQPQWKYLASSSERNRKRVHYANKLSLPRNIITDESLKKRKDHSPRQVGQNPGKVKERNKENHGLPDMRISQQADAKDLHEQRALFDMLKPTLLILCETLMLKDGVKRLAERFLEFVLNNHQVTKKPETILQAFQISVCWIAAEVLEKKLDHGGSLDIARKKMNFRCLAQEADSVYSKMKQLMKIFLSRNLEILESPVDPASATDNSTEASKYSLDKITAKYSLDKLTAGFDESSRVKNNEKYSLQNADSLKKKCEKKIKRLQEKQNGELVDFEKECDKKRLALEDTYKLESAVIRYAHTNSTALVNKLKILDDDHYKRRKDLESEVSNLRKNLEARHQEEREEEQKKITRLFKLLNPQFANNTQFQKTEDMGLCKNSNGILPVIENLPEDQNSGEEPSGTHLPAMLSHNVDNDFSRDVPTNLSENQKDSCENVNSAHSLENASGIQRGGTANLAGEKNSCLGGPCVEPVPVTCQQEASCQGFKDQLCQQPVEGVEMPIRPLTEIFNTSPGSETSLLDPANPVLANFPHDGGKNVASNGQLINHPNEVQASIQSLSPHMQQPRPRSVDTCTDDANIRVIPTHVSATRASIALASHPNPVPVVGPTNSRASLSYHQDPLQNEYDRIRKEIGDITNSHEGKKLRLRSECDKEIEEAVAQIRRRYDAKLEEAESSFSLRKNELELNQNMVMMNKFLADALRSKCNDYKATSEGVPRRGASSTSLGIQQQPATRPSSVPGSSSVTQTAYSPGCGPPPVRSVLPAGARPGIQSTSPPAVSSNNLNARAPLQPSPAFNSCHSRPRQPENFGSEHALNLSFNPGEFLMDIARQNESNVRRLSNNLPALPDNNIQNHDSCDLSQFEEAVDVQQPGGAVVCLSDD